MRRNSHLINLHDRPLFPRPSSRYAAPASSGMPVLFCGMIATGVAAFFWAYGEIVHSDPPFVPTFTQTAGLPDYQSPSFKLAGLSAPAPDMSPPAVAVANADAVGPHRADANPKPAEPLKKLETSKKRVRTVKRLSPQAAQAYAWGAPPWSAQRRDFFRAPFGGF